MRKLILALYVAIICPVAYSQTLQPGFSGKEYTDMLQIAFQRFDSAAINRKIPVPDNYYVVYRSPVTGLKNCWNMWYSRDNKVAVISIRGTINSLPSWLENFYAAMIPATGSLQLDDSTVFNYQLSADSKAQVHVGWTIGLAYMAPAMLQQIRLAYEKGIHEFIIVGHSQGGALAFLARSYLFYLSEKGELPKDIIWKTYCSGAPKPGNLYYGYDFDFITRNGWAFTVVNAADWVPETPFSIQRLTDFNAVNPFIHVEAVLKKQKLLLRWYMQGKYNKMSRTTRRAQENFGKTLGSFVYKLVKKNLPQLREPVYAEGNNYQRAGSPVVLQPDTAYYKRFPNETKNVFQHHMFEPYYMLAKKYYE